LAFREVYDERDDSELKDEGKWTSGKSNDDSENE
jgi:hypothetical protein